MSIKLIRLINCRGERSTKRNESSEIFMDDTVCNEYASSLQLTV